MILIYGCGHFSLCNTMQHVQIRSGKTYMIYNLSRFLSIWDIYFASCDVQIYVLSYNIPIFEFQNVQLLGHLRALMLGSRKISRQCEDLIYQSRWLDTSWVILTRCLIGYSDGAKVFFELVNRATYPPTCPFWIDDDVIKWKHILLYWTLVWGVHRWPANSSLKDQWRGALLFLLSTPEQTFE